MKYLSGFLLASVTVFSLAIASKADAAKHWDPYTAIDFVVAGTEDPIAPSNVGSNGLQQDTYNITTFNDTDHWID
nr:hypothetical protein [Armatimonadota bacterium]